ncbi:tetratricopeptide repeat protein [Aestuariivivens sediminis]|uniref:tetratricopeptide repeat protein n=1 Tax=Aestuariivivens sediminis TaxID=2913557 RepID=UPI001F589453|nr:hypothetical protein [Aestuariivivens sediminis]
MKQIIFILSLSVCGLMQSQSPYEKGMETAFELWKNSPIEASNLFERIAQAEPDNWLPPYYAAQILIINSFGLNNVEQLTAQLNKAQDLINEAQIISNNNPEIMVLQALLHTAWLAYDGATYGRTLSPKIMEIYNTAEQLAPENPRVTYCKAEWNMRSAQYFGQDTAPYCKDFEKALELFANFKPETSFHPNWGKERTTLLLESCRN